MKTEVIPQGGVEPPMATVSSNFEWKKLVDARFKAPYPSSNSATASIGSSSSPGPSSAASSVASSVSSGGNNSRNCFWNVDMSPVQCPPSNLPNLLRCDKRETPQKPVIPSLPAENGAGKVAWERGAYVTSPHGGERDVAQ